LHRQSPRLLEKLRLDERLGRQVGGLLVIALSLLRRAKRSCAYAGEREHLACLRADLGTVLCVRSRRDGGQVVRGEHLGHLVGVGEHTLQMSRRGQVARRALAFGERLVGDVANEVLQEAVLTALGRARIGLHPEHFLAHQPGQQRLQLRLGRRRERGKRRQREGLAEHRSVLQQPPLLGQEAIQAGGDQRVQGLGHLERLDLARRRVHGSLLGEQTAIEQHPHRLDRIQRHPLRARQDLVAQPLGQARHQPLE